MRTPVDPDLPRTICVNCGVPIDSQHFDDSGFSGAPAPGKITVLARFALPPQCCGVLEYFSQFTDAAAQSARAMETPGVQWLLTVNDRPLFPYVGFDRILNPWGFGSFPVNVRLDEGAIVEFSVRGVSPADPPASGLPVAQRVGGRIAGRYWYNVAYGDPVRKRF